MNGKDITLKELLELRDIMMELKELGAKIQDFEDRHTFADIMKKSLDSCIAEIQEASHILHYDIYKIKKRSIDGDK